MIDSSLDRGMELGDRQAAIAEAQLGFRTRAAAPAALSPRRGRLTVAEAVARKTQAREAGRLEASTAVLEVPAKGAATTDSSAALRHARIGFLCAAVLILLLVWIMQRKNGGQ